MFARISSPVVFTAAVTGASVGSSMIAATVAMLFAGYSDFLFAFALSAGVPAILVPLTIYPLVRANRELRATQAELRKVARTDDLTGLPNRRAFFEEAEHLFMQAAVSARSVAAMMVDLDRFKEVNDTHGHIVGDAVLAAVGARIQETVAAHMDAEWIVARLGGEEFAILAVGLTSSSVARLADRVGRDVREADFGYLGTSIRSTVSIGVSIRSGDAEVDAVLKAADDAAYVAKRAGRDRWSFAIPTGRPAGVSLSA